MSSISDSIMGYVPYLRRYARALTGTQDLGDRYVRLCLQAMADDPGCLEEDQPIRRQIYKRFHATTFNVVNGAPFDRSASRAVHPLETHVRGLPTLERQVLLLTVVERFAVEDVAFILSLSRTVTQDLLEQTRSDFLEQCATTVLVIEDEPVIAFDIAGILMEMGHRVIGTAATKIDAVAKARKAELGLVLADIRLDDGSTGIEAVSEILGTSDIPVVYVTAFPERLLTGRRPEPVYLVTKPFEPEVLKVTVAQALFARAKAPPVGLTA